MRNASLFLLVMVLAGCSKDPFPRPKGYPRIDLPEKKYERYHNPICPFSFEYPAGAKVEHEQPDSCIADFRFTQFDYNWHLTYRSIPGSGKTRRQHEEEYLKLVMKHTQKMDYLNELQLESASGWGTLYELQGEVGAPAQLIFGDSSHLVMASFYFRQAISQDSLAPLIARVKEDLIHAAESMQWHK